MRIIGFSLILMLFSCSAQKLQHKKVSKKKLFSILQTSTDASSTVLRVIYPKALKLQISVKNDKEKDVEYKVLKRISKKYSAFSIMHIGFKDLKSSEKYSIVIKSEDNRWFDKREFRTLPKKENFKILVVSCMSDTHMELGYKMWKKALSHKADLNFLIGDNLYADTFSGIYLGNLFEVDERHLWERHLDHAMKMGVYFQKELTPTLTTWDDHDFGKNNGNKSYKYKRQSLRVYKSFFPIYKNDYTSIGPGVSHRLNYSGLNFYFLDGRYFRDKKSVKGSHFGRKQLRWLKRDFEKSSNNTFLINGDQFFGDYHSWESFAGEHPEKFQSFIELLKKSGKKFNFISGDRHMLELMKITKEVFGYEAYEFTISGLHTKMYPGSLKRDPNPRRIGGFDGKANFGIFSFDRIKKRVKFGGYSSFKKESELTFSF